MSDDKEPESEPELAEYVDISKLSTKEQDELMEDVMKSLPQFTEEELTEAREKREELGIDRTKPPGKGR